MNRVLLTGAFGNIGLSTLDELLVRGYNVRVFDIPSRKNIRKFRKYKKTWDDRITAKWGDLRNYRDVETVMDEIGAVIHLGAIIPPLSSKKPDMAYEVNVGGTSNILKAMEMKSPDAHLIFTSSFTIFGNRQVNPIISLGDSFNPVSNYAKHKIECENLIQSSKLKWTILRLTWVPSLHDLKSFRAMFDVPLKTKIEICLKEDVTLSLVNALNNSDALNEIFNIGCGASCRTSYGEYLMEMFDIFGLGKDAVPAEAFSHKGTFGGWIKPQGAQRVLKYQQSSLNGYYDDIRKEYRFYRFLVKIVKPLAKFIIRKLSPYMKKYTKYHTISEYLDLIKEEQFKLNLVESSIQESVV
ncbi:MAG: NAD-dependent epimerase/dehydratase family protein [Promethearchaeota archaeon]|jgi:nucleoside-diphosphate-sugar epimerase